MKRDQFLAQKLDDVTHARMNAALLAAAEAMYPGRRFVIEPLDAPKERPAHD